MKVLVTFYSQTGNTKKVAEAIHQVIDAEKCLKELTEVHSFEDFDLIFVGFPLHYGRPAKSAKTFLEQYAQGKKIALFITHATREDSKGLEKWLARCKKAASGGELVGFFNCQGDINIERLNRAGNFARSVLEAFKQ